MWFRLKDLYSTNTLFGSSDFTNDIIQGMASDCYLMSGIYGVAESDQRFEKVFVNKDQVAAGIYAVNAYVGGKPTIITVDD
jgi:Calpain family cysteine protease